MTVQEKQLYELLQQSAWFIHHPSKLSLLTAFIIALHSVDLSAVHPDLSVKAYQIG